MNTHKHTSTPTVTKLQKRCSCKKSCCCNHIDKRWQRAEEGRHWSVGGRSLYPHPSSHPNMRPHFTITGSLSTTLMFTSTVAHYSQPGDNEICLQIWKQNFWIQGDFKKSLKALLNRFLQCLRSPFWRGHIRFCMNWVYSDISDATYFLVCFSLSFLLFSCFCRALKMVAWPGCCFQLFF